MMLLSSIPREGILARVYTPYGYCQSHDARAAGRAVLGGRRRRKAQTGRHAKDTARQPSQSAVNRYTGDVQKREGGVADVPAVSYPSTATKSRVSPRRSSATWPITPTSWNRSIAGVFRGVPIRARGRRWRRASRAQGARCDAATQLVAVDNRPTAPPASAPPPRARGAPLVSGYRSSWPQGTDAASRSRIWPGDTRFHGRTGPYSTRASRRR